MTSQIADGLFLAAVLLTVVFLPEQQNTVRGFALATTLFLLPFSLLGPFAGVFLGFLTVGAVARRVPEPVLIGVAFLLAALSPIPAVVALGAVTLSVGAAILGASYAWTRVPADTLAQRAVPDRYRGRVFTVMDLGFNAARVLGALVAIPVVPRLDPQATLVVVALLFLLWAPVTPLWLRAGRGD